MLRVLEAATGGSCRNVRRIMHIRDNSKAQGWFRKHAAAPSSVGSWKAFVARNKTVQEPLNMADGGRIGFKRGKQAVSIMNNSTGIMNKLMH